MASPAPGSNAALLGIVDRITRLAANEQTAGTLPQMDLDQLKHRAQEAAHMLAPTSNERPAEAATPALCALAVACVGVVENAELTTGLARLVSAGCEVLAGLLVSRAADGSDEVADGAGHFSWVEETLEDLCDQLDFLSLEVYCGLGRLESAVMESDALPIVLDPGLDDFGSYWGSLEHRQALQELSAWLLCVVFRALGYKAVTAKRLMEFANFDCLLLCALLRGLFATRAGDTGLPHDLAEIQGVALEAVSGLTAPELAFPCSEGSQNLGIEVQNQALDLYLEVVCAAVVETGLLETALEVSLSSTRKVAAGLLGKGGEMAPLPGARFLAFLAAIVLEAETAVVCEDDPRPPPIHLRQELCGRADTLGSLLEAVLAAGSSNASQLRDLVLSCVTLSAALASQRAAESSDDAFTLACRMLLETSLEFGLGPAPEAEAATVLVALAALAANVEDLEISRARLVELAAGLRPEDRAKARSRLTRKDRMRLPVHGGAVRALVFFEDGAGGETAELAAAGPAAERPRPPEKKPQATGIRDLVQNAPEEFRCKLDGKLLCDPVVSPGGVVFERMTLARWQQAHGEVCPVTKVHLKLEDCQRSLELRKKVTAWVRANGRQRAGKKKS